MLRLWSKPNTLVIGTEQILLHEQGSDIIELPLKAKVSAPAVDLDDLLLQLTPHLKRLSRRPLNIILSNGLVRYSVLPWRANLYRLSDWQALAENHLRQIHGSISAVWQVKVGMQGYRHPLVIAALDRTLVEGLENLARQQSLRVNKVEPAFISVANHYRRRLHGDAWLLMAEKERLLLAQAERGVWQRITVAMPPAGEERQHALTLIRQAAQQGSITNKTKLFQYGSPVLSSADLEDIPVEVLSPAAAAQRPMSLNYGFL